MTLGLGVPCSVQLSYRCGLRCATANVIVFAGPAGRKDGYDRLIPLTSRAATMALMKRLLQLLSVIAASLLLAIPAAAQELRIGVVVSRTGSAAAGGAEQQAAVDGVARRILLNPAAALRNVTLIVRDDGNDPARALAAVTELVEQEAVHAIVCCTSPEAASRIAAYVDTQRVLTISPAAVPSGQRMLLTLQPTELTRFRALGLAARSLGGGLGLLTVDGPQGDDYEAAFRAGALEAGVPVTRVVQFSLGSRPLTPEALLVATSAPAAVVLWAGVTDTRSALDALDARGWAGPVILPYPEAAALAQDFGVGELHFVVPPVMVTGSLPDGYANQPEVSSYRVAASPGLQGGSSTGLAGALVYDALNLLLAAHEQALAYGVSPASTEHYRQALFDGLVSSGSRPLAAGTYRFDGVNPSLALPSGLVPAVGRGGRFMASW